MQALKKRRTQQSEPTYWDSRGGKTTKTHTLVDGLGNPLAFLLTGGQTHDAVPAIPLLEQIDVAGSNILGDKAYGAEPIREWISAQGGTYMSTDTKKWIFP